MKLAASQPEGTENSLPGFIDQAKAMAAINLPQTGVEYISLNRNELPTALRIFDMSVLPQTGAHRDFILLWHGYNLTVTTNNSRIDHCSGPPLGISH
jgi:hypothetical protein